MKKSKLLLPTFDAQLTKLKITPKCHHTKVSYKLKLYDEALQRTVAKTMRFEDVVSIEFRMNYFDNPIGAEVCGFYEVFSRNAKKEMLERNFTFRKDSTLFHGDYNYDPRDPHDLLNNRDSIKRILKKLDHYRLFQQHTVGGTYLLLAKRWSVD